MPDASEDIILGMDFLRRSGTTIMCAGLFCRLPELEETNDTDEKAYSGQHLALSSGRAHTCEENNTDNNPSEPEFQSPPSTVSTLSTSDQEKINKFLSEELGQFKDLHGVSTVASHRIVMNDDRPFKLRYAARNPAMQTIIYEKVNELLAKGFIES